jgi:hypothetical protein
MIVNFFSPISVSTSNVTLGEDCLLDNEHDSMIEHNSDINEPDDVVESDSDSSLPEDGEMTNDELILNIERQLNGTVSQDQRWRLAAVLHYLRLLKFENSKMEASLCVARQLGKNVYLARRIRSWASVLSKGEEVPVSMRGKHVKVKSLLKEEDVQHEVLQYLRTSKFEFYLADFVRYVSDDIFPKLGISRTMPIGYEAFIYYSFMHEYYPCISCDIEQCTQFSVSKTTAQRWLKRMGFEFKQYAKGVYIDGHERGDVVEYRKEFLANMRE